MKFETVGADPLTGAPLNLIEQLNQTFTVLATLRAVEQLLSWHPDADGYRLALTTASGRDIESVRPNYVSAEVFAATHPTSNQKLRKDMARLALDPAPHRYVFFAATAFSAGRHARLERHPGVQVHCVDI